MRSMSIDEYRLVPVEGSKPAELPSPLHMDLRSSDPIPLLPLTQLPELASRSRVASDRVDDGVNPSIPPEDVRVDKTGTKNRKSRRRSSPGSNSDSSAADNSEVDKDQGGAWRIQTSDGPVWLEGDTILCACPDCDAPMSVRLWLLLAQCWRCDTQIELTEEQQRAVESLLHRREHAARQTPPEPGRTAPPQPQPVAAVTSTPPPPAAPASRPQPRPAERHEDTRHASMPGYRSFRRRQKSRRMTPAWLISLVLHFVLVLLLALLAISDYVEMDSITLSSFVGTADREGGIVVDATESEPSQFELPLPVDADLDDDSERAELEEAAEDAKEIREDDNPVVELPELEAVRDRLTAETSDRSHFVARDPRLRVEIMQKEGGTTVTEAAVARGLNWLARHQNRDGSWSLEDYESSNRASNKGDAAATSLALLPFLGAGQTHEYGRYKDVVASGLMWLLTRQEDSGDLRAGMTSQMGMYAHGQATIVLVEALALSGDERFRGPAQRAIDFIVNAQHELGGWRYRPGQEGDTSVLGWQLMALQSARSPGVGLEVPDTALQLASYYLDLCTVTEGATYAYQPRDKNDPTPTMTAEALLCRMYLGWSHDDPRFEAGLEWMVDRLRPSTRRKNIYYWYYATQALHNYGGEMWEDWNLRIQDVLTELQETRGRHAGSWNPDGFEFGGVGDRVYVTALAVCTLEVYYRHLPIFRRIELDEPGLP